MADINLPTNQALMQMAGSYRISQVLYVTATLGIADLLKDTPKRSYQLAAECGASPEALFRLLRALVNLNILVQDPDGRFTLTPSGTYLLTDHPCSVRPYILYVAAPVIWESWGNFIYSVFTGETAIKYTFGLELFDFTAQNPEFEEVFDNGMAGMTISIANDLVTAYDFSQFKRVIDIGGGNGSLLEALLKAYPTLEGTLFDQPQVAAKAARLQTVAELGARLKIEVGNFFESVPGGADAYILKYILHDWTDSNAIEILKSCHQAMRAGAKLLVVEAILPGVENIDENEPSLGKIFMDLQMLALTGGRERTESEFQHLFKSAGFQLTGVIPLSANLSIIEGVPV